MFIIEINDLVAKELGAFLQKNDVGIRSEKVYDAVYRPLYLEYMTREGDSGWLDIAKKFRSPDPRRVDREGNND